MRLSQLLPDQYLRGVECIDLQALWGDGKRALIIDVDNTVALRKAVKMTDKARTFVEAATKMGFTVVFLSNVVGGGARVRRVCKICGDHLSVCAFWPRLKPNQMTFRAVLSIADAQPHEAVMIGDQVFTDVYGANRCGMYTVLVRPLGKDHWATTPKRWVEWLLLSWLDLSPA